MTDSTDSRRFPTLELALASLFVLAVLFMLIRPAFQQARSGLGRPPCLTNLHHLVLALHNYHSTFGSFPASATTDDLPPRTWRVDLLSFLDAAPVPLDYYRPHEPWESAHNTNVAREKRSIYRCPTDVSIQDERQRYYTSYAGVVGPQAFFPNVGARSSFRELTDGTTTTIALVEASGGQIVWTEPRDINVGDRQMGINLKDPKNNLALRVIGSSHEGVANVALVDGSTRTLSEKIDPKVLQALLTVNGGETVGDY